MPNSLVIVVYHQERFLRAVAALGLKLSLTEADILTADSAVAALDLAHSSRADLLVLDANDQQGDVRDLVRRAHAREWPSRVVLAGQFFGPDAADPSDMGADAVVDNHELLIGLRRALFLFFQTE